MIIICISDLLKTYAEAKMTKNPSLEQNRARQDLPVLSINTLLQGKKYAWISHAGETYLLQLTKANKLLLTK